VYYCDATCQRKDWSVHKSKCKTIVRDNAATTPDKAKKIKANDKVNRKARKKKQKQVAKKVKERVKKAAVDFSRDDECYLEMVDDDLECLCRRLPSGRVIRIDTMFQMMNGGVGMAHLNMNNMDNRPFNLGYVAEREARAMLMAFEE
jgi:hypothetical protein